VDRNIRLIVCALRENQIGVVLQSVLFMSALSEANPRIARLNVLLQGIAADETIPFLDLNPILAPAGALLPEVTYDGLHLAARGYVLWSKALQPFPPAAQGGMMSGLGPTTHDDVSIPW
jgi:lysophospholipase L1-like esterase